jgi:predicted transposase YdaD
LAAVSGILAGLVLTNETIRRFLRQDIMRESVFYQEIEAQGEQRGRREEAAVLVLRQLTYRFVTLPEPLVIRIGQLSLAQLEALSIAWLNFQSISDLEAWLERG